MNDNSELPLKKFSAKVMLTNIGLVKTIIQRIRQREGGIGSDGDELSLHRMIQDLDLLIDIVDGLKAHYDELAGKLSVAVTSVMTVQKQNKTLKERYEEMLTGREDRIKQLEIQLGVRSGKDEPESK